MSRYSSVWGLALVILSVVATPPASADIVIGGTGSNTGPDPAGVGQYEGVLSNTDGQHQPFLGTVISQNTFLTANHIGGNNSYNTFTINGTTYGATQVATQNDVSVWQISGGTFASSSIAPVYTGSNERGLPLIDYGYGTTRGVANYVPPGTAQQDGWHWGTSHAISWGTGTVYDTPTDSNLGRLVQWFFSNTGDPNTGILSQGDSGGGLFVRDVDGVWKLAGINYGVDTVYTRSTDNNGNAVYTAQGDLALYNMNGYYVQDQNGNFILVTNGQPMSSYTTSVSSHVPFLVAGGFLSVPEPSSLALSAVGGVGLTIVGWRRRRARVDLPE